MVRAKKKGKLDVIHISMSDCTNQTRLFKQAQSIASIFDAKVGVLGLGDKQKKLSKIQSEAFFTIYRIFLLSRLWPTNLFVQLIKYFEWSIRSFCLLIVFQPRVIVAHAPSILPLAIFYKLFFWKIGIIYDAHELEFEKNGLSSFRKKSVVLIEKVSFRHINTIQVVGDKILEKYIYKYPKYQDKFKILYNVPRYRCVEKNDYFRTKFLISDKKLIYIYQGGLSPNRGLELIVQSFIELGNEDYNQAVLVVMGDGVLKQKLQEMANSRSNIFFHDYVSPNKVLSYTVSADVGLSMTETTCENHVYCLPNKLFEYSMACLPIIIHRETLEQARLIKQHDTGFILESYSAQSIKELIIDIGRGRKKLPSQKQFKAFNERYNWENEEKKLIEIYMPLLQNTTDSFKSGRHEDK